MRTDKGVSVGGDAHALDRITEMMDQDIAAVGETNDSVRTDELHMRPTFFDFAATQRV